MTTLASPGIHIGPEGVPAKTLGWQILGWTNDYLLQPDGNNAGRPWEFTDEQARFVLWWYAIDDQGRFVYRRGMLRRMKGWGKDPLAAAISCVEFVGPCRFDGWSNGEPKARDEYAAWIQIAAVSKDQTRNTMTLFPGMLSQRAIDEFQIDLGKEIIYALRGQRRIEAITSSPRAVEGGRPTFSIKNESHHWLKSNEGLEMSAVMARNSAKLNSRVLAISNAHNPGEESDAEHDYAAYLQISGGQSKATGFLYDSLEAPPETDLTDRDDLRKGLEAARGDSKWLDVDRLIEEIYDPNTPPSTSRRYYLNQIIASEDAWLTPQEWDACKAEKTVEAKEIVTLGFDGSKSNDHTVLMACRVDDSHLFPIDIWDPANTDNLVPTAAVDAAVQRAFDLYDVVGFYADVNEWESYTDKWEQEHGETLCALSSSLHPVKWDMRRSKEAALAAEAYHDAIIERDLTHSGDKRIDQYHYNARRRKYISGAVEIVTFGKESMFSSRKVDGVAAALLARKARQDYLALPENKKRQTEQTVGVYFA